MSAARVELRGLVEFREALRRLPAELTDEAGAIVRDAAANAQSEIQQAYPEGPTGNLRRGVVTDHYASRWTSHAIVRSRAKHANLFEFGTRPRRTVRGANRGAMPPAPPGQAMIPIVIRRRKRMVEQLKDLVRRAGFRID